MKIQKRKIYNLKVYSLNRNKILEEMGAFSKIQANALQSNVLNLLTFDNSSGNIYNNSFSSTDNSTRPK